MNVVYFSYFICGAMIMLTLTGLVGSAIMPFFDHWNKRYFITLFSVLFLVLVSLQVDLMVYDDPTQAVAETAAAFCECLFAALLIFMPTIYLLHYCETNWKKSPFSLAEIIILGVFLVLLISTLFTTVFCYVTPDNHFYRGKLFPLLILPLIIMIVINIVSVIRRRKQLSGKMIIAFLVYLIPLLISLIIHVFSSAFMLIGFSLMISSLVMSCLILSEQIEHNRRQRREIARQNANIMILQMRPHFVYNSLTSIYYLCEQDPKKAQQVIYDFTTYLRKNFNAISSENTIPFLDELAHTKAYLSVENALHEDLLFIDYDTPHTHFRVPPLTLQPIVENAIKHGLDPDAEPLHISVRTLKTDSNTEIIVEDNGKGFEPSDNHNPHSALENIRQRLSMMCGGEMSIISREEGGTIVKMSIPLQEG